MSEEPLPWFPAELGKPQQDGYSYAAGDARRMKRSDEGISVPRRRFSRVAAPLTLTYKWEAWQRGRFWRFYREEIDEGHKGFRLPDPTRDGWSLLGPNARPLRRADGSPILINRTLYCLLGDRMPEERIKGVKFLVSLTVAVMP